jgi:hypothetical protein
MGQVLGIICRCIATHVIRETGFSVCSPRLREQAAENNYLAGDEFEAGPAAAWT